MSPRAGLASSSAPDGVPAWQALTSAAAARQLVELCRQLQFAEEGEPATSPYLQRQRSSMHASFIYPTPEGRWGWIRWEGEG